MWWAMKIFGSGHGMAAPYFDQKFLWLVDTSRSRERGKGRFYAWIGGYGAQLRSFEWRCPKPGEERELMGYKFQPFIASRGRFGRFGLLWDISWAVSDRDKLEDVRRQSRNY